MLFSAAEITAWIGALLWPFFRIGAMVMSAPITGAQTVPMRVKLFITLVLTMVIAPQLPPAPQIDPFSPMTLLLIIQQVLIGVAMGTALQLVFAAIVTGGQIIAYQMGLGFASMVDPQTGVTVPVVSQLYLLATSLLYLAFNGHLVLIEVVAESFNSMPIAPDGLTRDGIWQLVSWGSEMFAGAVLISIPTVAAILVVNIAFGVMVRAAPQLNIFAVGFPVTLTLGFLAMMFTFPSLLPQTEHLVQNVFLLIRTITSGQ
ncbi:MAG TPA: flagellar biosynthetic protein FliR [Gammaproteobacteria bacterium]|nr:flagellar biosynthetic protein FliR [Gammaproteobacteria bacterium]